MTGNCIYGVDLSAPVTPIMVRDAIVECFYEAHCIDTGLSDDDPAPVKKYCADMVVDAFAKTGGDFENPTKDSIFVVLNQLAEFSKNFRSPAVVKQHFNEIMKLVALLP